MNKIKRSNVKRRYVRFMDIKISNEIQQEACYRVGDSYFFEGEPWHIKSVSKDVLPLSDPPNTYTLQLSKSNFDITHIPNF